MTSVQMEFPCLSRSPLFPVGDVVALLRDFTLAINQNSVQDDDDDIHKHWAGYAPEGVSCSDLVF